jgi:hypothetical protein
MRQLSYTAPSHIHIFLTHALISCASAFWPWLTTIDADEEAAAEAAEVVVVISITAREDTEVSVLPERVLPGF